MIRIIDKRGTGKTYRLLNKASQTGGIIVSFNSNALEAKAKAYGLDMSKCIFMSIYDFIRGHQAYDNDSNDFPLVYFDELESCIRTIFPLVKLAGYTLSVED